MTTQFESIRQQQKDSWNKISSGWKKWDHMTMEFLKPMGDEIIRTLNIKDDDIVLDVAAGTGEPGLTMATMLTNGKVYITDIAENMVAIARENATRRGIKNVETITAEVSDLPFADNTFDVISCRFGFMFFPDMELAATEMVRVLKPGGRIAASVWNVGEKNFWVTAIMNSIHKYIELPAAIPGAPGMFRCAAKGFMADLFSNAGLKNIAVTEVAGKLHCGDAEGYWNFMNEVAGPVAAALSKVDEQVKATIKNEVVEAVNQRYPVGNTMVDSNGIIIYGVK
ncbi:methyltransferase domain-containing protein [soil metagenome]